MRLLISMCCTAALMMPACTSPDTLPETAAEMSVDISNLVGVWDVALFFDADQAPSSTVLDITAIDADTVTGQFYGTPFEFAKALNFKGDIRLSFVTSDGSGPYTSAARLMPDGTLSGQTLSTGRNFLMPWTAAKKQN